MESADGGDVFQSGPSGPIAWQSVWLKASLQAHQTDHYGGTISAVKLFPPSDLLGYPSLRSEKRGVWFVWNMEEELHQVASLYRWWSDLFSPPESEEHLVLRMYLYITITVGLHIIMVGARYNGIRSPYNGGAASKLLTPF